MDVALVDVRVVEVVDNTVGVVHVLVVDVLEDNVDVLVVDVTLVDFEVTNDDVVLVVCQRLREETHKACDESSLGGGHGTGHSEQSGDIWIRKESTPRCPWLLIT